MKPRLLLLAVLMALGLLPGARADEPKPTGAAIKPAIKTERPETELEKTMTKMGKTWRQVRKAARDGQLSPTTAELVATVRMNAEAAIKLTPALEAEQASADQAKFRADYQAQMKKLIATLRSLESALKSNDIETATNLIGEVGDLMKGGHKEFKKPDER